MPTNLPPDYFEIEKRFRQAQTPEEQIPLLEEMYSVVPKHKGTDHLRADLRRRLSKLKEAAAEAQKKSGKRDSVFRIDRAGAGQVAVVGLTNVGKSALVEALTDATPVVSEVPNTTWEPAVGMMPIEDIRVQLIDTPPLSSDFVEPGLHELIKRADLILLVVDLQTSPNQQLEETAEILCQHRIVPRHQQERYVGEHGMTIKPFLVLVNRCDDESLEELCEIFGELLEEKWPVLPVSAITGHNLERLKQMVFENLDIIRVYTKVPGKDPDMSRPFVLKKGSTVEDFAGKIHKDFVANLKMARVWGEGVFEGQSVRRNHVLHDGDVVELHI